MRFWAVFAIFAIFGLLLQFGLFFIKKNTQITARSKKAPQQSESFRAFLLKKGKILNNGKTQIDQFTREGSILEQKIKDIRVVQN